MMLQKTFQCVPELTRRTPSGDEAMLARSGKNEELGRQWDKEVVSRAGEFIAPGVADVQPGKYGSGNGLQKICLYPVPV